MKNRELLNTKKIKLSNINIKGKIRNKHFKSNNESFFNKRLKLTIITIFTAITFTLSLVGIVYSLKTMFFKHESKVFLFSEDNRKFVKNENDIYVVEEMILESGSALPDISYYFTDGTIIQDDATILYYRNNELISLDSFTIEEEGMLYVYGTPTITVVINNGEKFEINLIVRDTKAPTVILKDVSIKAGESLDPNSFVDFYSDNSFSNQYGIYFVDEVDFSKAGIYNVNLKICDYSNNCSIQTGNLVVEEVIVEHSSTQNGSSTSSNKDSNKNNSGNSSNGSSSGNSGGGSSGSNTGSSVETSNGGSTGNSGGNSGSSSSGNISNNNDENEKNIEDILNLLNSYDEILSNTASGNADSIASINREIQKIMPTYNSNITFDEELSVLARLRTVEIATKQCGSAYNMGKTTSDGECKIIDKNNHYRYDGRLAATFVTDATKALGMPSRSYIGEIYFPNGPSTVKEVMEEFYKSESHKKIIENQGFTRYGIGKFAYRDPNTGIYRMDYTIIFTA